MQKKIQAAGSAILHSNWW